MMTPPSHYDISPPGMPGVTIWSHSLFAWECTPSGTGAIYIYIYEYGRSGVPTLWELAERASQLAVRVCLFRITNG